MNTFNTPTFVIYRRYLGAIGSLMAGLSVALAAYATHAVEGVAQGRLWQAAAMAFAHGLALAALTPFAQRPMALIALLVILVGVFLFSMSLLGAVVIGLGTSVVIPFGGALVISGWLLYAYDRLRG